MLRVIDRAETIPVPEPDPVRRRPKEKIEFEDAVWDDGTARETRDRVSTFSMVSATSSLPTSYEIKVTDKRQTLYGSNNESNAYIRSSTYSNHRMMLWSLLLTQSQNEYQEYLSFCLHPYVEPIEEVQELTSLECYR
jgi:hypothetical protein